MNQQKLLVPRTSIANRHNLQHSAEILNQERNVWGHLVKQEPVVSLGPSAVQYQMKSHLLFGTINKLTPAGVTPFQSMSNNNNFICTVFPR